MYSRRNEAVGKIHIISSFESEHCKNVTAPGFATAPSLDLSDRLPICSNHDDNYYRWQQMLNGSYIDMIVKGELTISSQVSVVIQQRFGRRYV